MSPLEQALLVAVLTAAFMLTVLGAIVVGRFLMQRRRQQALRKVRAIEREVDRQLLEALRNGPPRS